MGTASQSSRGPLSDRKGTGGLGSHKGGTALAAMDTAHHEVGRGRRLTLLSECLVAAMTHPLHLVILVLQDSFKTGALVAEHLQHTHTHTHMHTHAHTCTHAHTHTHTHAHTCTHTRTHTHTHACTHARTHMHARTHGEIETGRQREEEITKRISTS